MFNLWTELKEFVEKNTPESAALSAFALDVQQKASGQIDAQTFFLTAASIAIAFIFAESSKDKAQAGQQTESKPGSVN